MCESSQELKRVRTLVYKDIPSVNSQSPEIVERSSMHYLDLAGTYGVQVEMAQSKITIGKAKSWTFTVNEAENDQRLHSAIQITENPLDIDEIHKVASRSASLGTYKTNRLVTSESIETFESISTCVEIRTVSELSKVHFKKLSPKFKKNKKKEGFENPDISMIMSPVIKRKMSRAHEVLVENENIKPNMGKRASVVFNVRDELCNGDDMQDNTAKLEHHVTRRSSHLALHGHRPSIFSMFSQVAGRSHRPSIFSYLSDFSISSLGSHYAWNFRRIFLLVSFSITFLVIVTMILIYFWPRFEVDMNVSQSFRPI